MMRGLISGLVLAVSVASASAQGADDGQVAPDFGSLEWQAQWEAADTDGDGRLSRDELLAVNPDAGELFDLVDADGDGCITAEEAQLAERVQYAAPLD